MLRALAHTISALGQRLGASPNPGKSSRRLELAELEDRILYSASPLLVEALVGVDDVGADPMPELSDEFALFEPTDQEEFPVPADDAAAVGEDTAIEAQVATTVVDAGGNPHKTAPSELIFVDTAVDDYQQLVADLLAERDADDPVEVILLDAERDGVEQITDQLAQYDDLDAVRILSHGTAGKVKLGNVWLSASSIDGYTGDIASWGNSLADGADLLLYGCDLAADQVGRELIEAIGILTGTDVAASVDQTGHETFGGDWDLEFATGTIETSAVFSQSVHDNWHGLLAAPVIVVDTSVDTADGDTTSIASLMADKGADGLISHREAIVAANNTPNIDGIDEIHFDIDGGGTQTIQLLTALPEITDPVIIDATTQSGYGGSPIIEIDGSLTTGADGLLITGGDSTIRGLVINRFDGDGIHLSGAGGNVIEGNYVGTNVSGNAALPNGGDGIEITSANNTVGGLGVGSRNVIAGNGQNGIRINGPAASGNTVLGNSIGTDSSGSLDLGNTGAGIWIANGSGNTIGDIVSGAGNTVAYNQDAGVTVEQGSANEIRGNAIYDNSGVGIDLGADGVTANDASDGDTGANDLQNYPSLDLAIVSASEIVINGSINSTPDTTIEIDFYSSTVGDPSDYGEGEVHLGSESVTTDSSGNASFSVMFTGVTTSAGDTISATATDPSGSTSEFSRNVMAAWDDPTIPDAALLPVVDGDVDDIWSASSLHVIRNVTIGDVSGPVDLWGTWKSLWDPDNLYLLVDVTDDMLIDDTGPADPWMDDMVEVYIDADFSQQSTYDGVNDFHFGFRWNDTTVYTGPNSVPDTSGITFEMVATATGYRLEAAIPWATLGVFPESGDAIGMDVQIADDDDGGARDGKLAWYATSEIAYQNPTAFAEVIVSSARNGSLWLSTGGDVTTPSGVSTLDSWDSGDALQFSNPRLQLEPGTTEGTLSVVAALNDLADDGDVNIDAIHYVTRDITIGGAASIDLLEGDLLLSTADDEGFTSTNSLNVADEDLFLFRPDVYGDYRNGTFIPVLHDLNTLLGIDELSSISLVELDTEVGDTTLLAGDFLFSRPGLTEGNDIYVFHTVDVGEGTTDGTVSLLIEGTDVGIDQSIAGLELVEQSVEIGGRFFPAGQMLVSLELDDDDIGDSLILAKAQDIFAVDFTATTLIAGTAAGDAAVVFEGGDFGLDSGEESPDALSLVHLGNSPTADIAGPYAINEGDSLELDASGSSDPDDDPLYYVWDLDNDGIYGDVTGEAPTVDWAELQSHGIVDQGTYSISVVVRDGTGGIDWATTTLTVNDTPPTLTTTGDSVYKVDKEYTLQLSATDPGDDTISSWTIDWGDGTIETLAGNPTSATHTYTQAGFTYDILASVTNEEGTFLQDPVPGHQVGIVTNRAPVANAGGPYVINETDSVTLDASGSVDPDDDPLTYSWDIDNDGTYGDVTGESPTLSWAQLAGNGITDDGTYTIGVLVNDGDGGIDTHWTAIIVNNLAPTAGDDTGAAFTTDEDTSFTTANVLANDTEANPVDTLAVTGVDTTGTVGTVTDNGDGTLFYDPNGQFESLSATQQAIDSFTYTLSDDDGGTNIATVTITIDGVNDSPTADDATFGAAENASDGATVGTISADDVDTGDTLAYSITGGNAGGAFAIDNSTGEITVANGSLLDFEATPTFVLTVEVQDAGGLTDAASVTINLSDVNETPTANAAIFGLDENSVNGTTVGMVLATDPDAGESLTYSITGGNTAGAFAIDNATGEIMVANTSVLDFETTSAYNLTVEVQDAGGLTDTASVTINLNDVNETPTAGDATFTLDENSANGTTAGTVAASDPDMGDTLGYSIAGGNTSGAFVIDNATGEITVANTAALDFETTPTFTLTVEVQDAGGLTDTASVTIDLNDVNEVPTAGDAIFSLDENTADGTNVGTVSAVDPDIGDTLTYSIAGGNTGGAFAVDSLTGAISVADRTALNFETTPTFNLLVDVQDTGGLIDTASITIQLTDVNETPTVDDATFGLVENSANGTSVGLVTANDPDAGDSLVFSITGGNTGGAFAIDSVTGEITVANSAVLDLDTTPRFDLTVEARDTSGLTDDALVTINLTGINEAPTVSDASFGITENSANGTAVGMVSASDPDAGDTVTYAITGGNTSGAFAIDSVTGEISVANNAALDFETIPAFDLTIVVQDGGGLTDTGNVTIDVGDVNEAPTANNVSFSLPENSPSGTNAGTVAGTDPDAGDTVTYSITDGNEVGAFAIDSVTGEITVADTSLIDFESTPTFRLTVSMQDGSGLTTTAIAAIDLTNVNEGPLVADAAFSLDMNSSNGAIVGTVPAFDPDAGEALTFSIVGGDPDGMFAIDGHTGKVSLANSDALDIESSSTVILTVQVEDAAGLADTAAATISLTDGFAFPTAINELDRDAGAPADFTQDPQDTPDSMPREGNQHSFAAGNWHIEQPTPSVGALPAAIQPYVEYAGRDLPAKSHLGDMSRRAELHEAADPTQFNIPATPFPGDARLGSDSGSVTRENEPTGATGDEDDRAADEVSQREEGPGGGSPDGVNFDPSVEQRVLSSNLIATASVSSCYLLSTVSAGAKIAAGKCSATPGTTNVQVTGPSRLAAQALSTTLADESRAECPTSEDPKVSRRKRIKPSLGKEANGDTANGEQQTPPDDCITQDGTSNAELESTTDRSLEEKPAFSTSWLLSFAGAVSRGLVSRFSGNSKPEDTAAEADLPIEHRLDRFLHAPADSSDRPPLLE
ncbi:MAG: cadherin domain-containing protein [Planctomycetes bacterium]|nr:cadherin domain-containing protein [Planctomycetota bacterium]